MNNFIDNPEHLLKMDAAELDDALLQDVYKNSANLRELIRRFVKLTKEYKSGHDYVYKQNYDLREALREMKYKIEKLID